MGMNSTDTVELISVVGFVGDRTNAGMLEVGPLSDELSLHLDVPYVELETSTKAGLSEDWQEVLGLAAPTFELARDGLQSAFDRGKTPVLVTARCALSVVTLPVALKFHPDAVVLWFDAHGDMHTPETSTSGYLGGMPVAAALGEWDGGYGAGLKPENLILVGARELDEAEARYISANNIAQYKVGDGITKWQDILQAVAGRPVYIHIDVDAFDPSEVPGEYVCPNGLTKAEVMELLSYVNQVARIAGVEIAEFQPKTPSESIKGALVLIECMRALFR